MNAEFQRTARRDKKAFLSNQWKEKEENNRMEKTRDLFKKIRDTNGTFHAKLGTVKDRNGSSEVKASACNAGDLGSISGLGRFPWRRKWQSTPVFLPGESHGQRNLVGYSPRGLKELDTTERPHSLEQKEKILRRGGKNTQKNYT